MTLQQMGLGILATCRLGRRSPTSVFGVVMEGISEHNHLKELYWAGPQVA